MHGTMHTVEKLTEYLQIFVKDSDVPIHENVVKLIWCLYKVNKAAF